MEIVTCGIITLCALIWVWSEMLVYFCKDYYRVVKKENLKKRSKR